jgi:hypothetical protein
MEYEFTSEFILAEAELRKRFFSAFEPSQGGESKEAAVRMYMDKMADLHDSFLESLALSVNEREEHLRIVMHNTTAEMIRQLPERQKVLEVYRDDLISRCNPFKDCQPFTPENCYTHLPLSTLNSYDGPVFTGPLLRTFRPLSKVHEPKPLSADKLAEDIGDFQCGLHVTHRLDEASWKFPKILELALHAKERLVISHPVNGTFTNSWPASTAWKRRSLVFIPFCPSRQ